MTSTPAPIPDADRPPAVSLLATIGFLLGGALLVVRSLLSEVYESFSFDFLPAGTTDVSGPTPALTVVLDAAQLLVAALLVWSGQVRINRWVGLALLGLLAAVILSSFAAANPRLALNAGGTLFCGAVLIACLAGVAWPVAYRRILLTVVLAVGALAAAKCILQVTQEFPDLRAMWAEQWAPLPAEARETPEFINFERRMKAAEPFAYQSHPNIAASLLLLLAFPAIGLVLAAAFMARADSGTRIGLTLLGLALAGAAGWCIQKTGSMGAVVAGGAGLTVLLLVAATRNFWLARPKLLGSLLFGGVAFAMLGLIGYGVARDALPHPSLLVRWYYWDASWPAWQEHPLTGIGRENFAAPYMRYKPASSTEEVRNPHSLFVSLWVELGPLGLLAGAMLLAAALWRSLPCRLLDDAAPARTTELSHPHEHAWMLFVMLALVFALHAWGGNTDFATKGFAELWVMELVVPGVFLALIAYRLLTAADEQRSALRTGLQIGAVAATFAMLLHNVIDYSLLTPAGIGLLGALLATLPWSGVAKAPALGRPVALALIVVVVLQAVFVVIPTAASVPAMSRLQASLRSDEPGTVVPPSIAAAALEKLAPAAVADTLDPAPARRIARWALDGALQANSVAPRDKLIDLTESYLSLALQRDPDSLGALRVQKDLALWQATRAADDAAERAALEVAYGAARRVADLYPTDPRGQIRLADSAARLFLANGDRDVAQAGLAALDTALEIDATRPPESAVRLAPAERAEIERLRAALQRPRPQP